MTLLEALALCEDLRKLAGDAPGPNPSAIQKSEGIVWTLKYEFPNNYIREKASEALEAMTNWCSTRKWQKWGTDPMHYRVLLNNSIGKLELAIRSFGYPTE